jgi:hypothetical protein
MAANQFETGPLSSNFHSMTIDFYTRMPKYLALDLFHLNKAKFSYYSQFLIHITCESGVFE